MKEILSQLVWFGVTSTILILIFGANNGFGLGEVDEPDAK